MSTNLQEINAISQDHDRLHIEGLLGRYPDIDDTETNQILYFFKHATALETALVTCNDKIRSNYHKFCEDHPRVFCLGPRDYMFVAIIFISIIISTYFLWNAGL